MSEVENLPEPKDRTKLIWGLVIALVAAMSLAIWWSGKANPNTSVVRLKHILVAAHSDNPADEARARELIQELRERIENGEDFGDLAAEYSNDPQSAARGGDIGYVEKGTLADEIEAYAWTASIGELSPVIKTIMGYHLVIVTDRQISEVDRLKMEKEREWDRQNSGGDETTSGDSAEPSSESANQ